MSDERSVEHSATAHQHPQKRSNWLNRLGHLLKGEPNDRDELADIITEAGERDIIDEDTQDMLEGVFEISELRVRDIMIPRSQMNTLPSDACATVCSSACSPVYATLPSDAIARPSSGLPCV